MSSGRHSGTWTRRSAPSSYLAETRAPALNTPPTETGQARPRWPRPPPDPQANLEAQLPARDPEAPPQARAPETCPQAHLAALPVAVPAVAACPEVVLATAEPGAAAEAAEAAETRIPAIACDPGTTQPFWSALPRDRREVPSPAGVEPSIHPRLSWVARRASKDPTQSALRIP